MKTSKFFPFLLVLTVVIAGCSEPVTPNNPNISFTVSMDDPASHYYFVEMHYSGLAQDYLTLRLPAWTPGYYMILDLAQEIVDFSPTDSSDKPLEWTKTDANAWTVNTKGLNSLDIEYFVFANRRSVAEPYLDTIKGFICPTGVFMHPENMISLPVSVSIVPWEEWTQVSTGLTADASLPYTYIAKDYDELYDCPILVGNTTIAEFEVDQIPHFIAIENAGTADLELMKSELKRIVITGTDLIGEIPYDKYEFLIMEQGGGGLEHRNSMAVYSNISDYPGTRSQIGWLGFMAHEYFHLFNVKSIRPFVLGPFDYNDECHTTDLWLSEGGTVYYQEIILNRAGFINSDGFLRSMERNIRNHENIPGHLFQSVAQSSWDTWINFFSLSANSRDVKISYYDKGCTISMLVDLAIRNGSKNKNSLDDVMRTLYYDYHKKQNRGFTSKELRKECEKAAQCDLSEIFDIYIPTTDQIDYSKYLAYAGLEIDLSPDGPEETILGKTFQKKKFDITRMDETTELQEKIFNSWLR